MVQSKLFSYGPVKSDNHEKNLGFLELNINTFFLARKGDIISSNHRITELTDDEPEKRLDMRTKKYLYTALVFYEEKSR